MFIQKNIFHIVPLPPVHLNVNRKQPERHISTIQFWYKVGFVRLYWGLPGGSEGQGPRNPQPTPSQPPGNPLGTLSIQRASKEQNAVELMAGGCGVKS